MLGGGAPSSRRSRLELAAVFCPLLERRMETPLARALRPLKARPSSGPMSGWPPAMTGWRLGCRARDLLGRGEGGGEGGRGDGTFVVMAAGVART